MVSEMLSTAAHDAYASAAHLQQVLDHLTSPEPGNLHLACAGVVALSEHAPTLLYQHLSRIQQGLWPAVQDGALETREAAVRAMRACLVVVGQRDRPLRLRWSAVIFDQALEALVNHGGAAVSEQAAHGSLCVLAELLTANHDALDEPRLEQAFEAAWAMRDSRQKHIRLATIQVLPSLATAAPHAQALRWLPQLASHLLGALHQHHGYEAQRAAALVALGRVALAIGGSAFAQYTPDVLNACHEALPPAPTIKSTGPGMPFGKSLRFEGRTQAGPAGLEALVCIECLARAHGAQLEPLLRPMLPHLFFAGLSVTLAATLRSLSEHLPALRPQLQALLLDTVAMLLLRTSFSEWAASLDVVGGGRYPGANGHAYSGYLGGHSVSDGGGRGAAGGDDDNVSRAQVALALQTLSGFRMPPPGAAILEFVRSTIASYLDDRQPTLRRAAAVTCIRLLMSSPFFDEGGDGDAVELDELDDAAGVLTLVPTGEADVGMGGLNFADQSWVDDDEPTEEERALLFGSESATYADYLGLSDADADATSDHLASEIPKVDEILERVLVVAVADEDPEVRHVVLSALSPRFDGHLAQTGKWELLLAALGDETAVVREAAVAVLGRLSRRNPAHVLPALRTQLLGLLTEIQHSSSLARKEAAASLLGTLVKAAPRLIRPYAASVLAVLQPQLRESVSALATLGELSVVAGSAVGPSMPQLLPQLLPLLHDHASSFKRRTALHALSQLLRSTGYPAQHAPDGAPSPSALLLSSLLAMLGSEHEASTRLELLRALGTLGAPDPSQQMQIQLARQRTASAAIVSIQAGDLGYEEGRAAGSEIDDESIDPAHPDFHPSVALRALTRILRDTSLAAQHFMVIRAMLGILWSLGAAKCLPFLPVVMPLLLHTASATQGDGEKALYSASLKETAIENLGHLISIIGLHVYATRTQSASPSPAASPMTHTQAPVVHPTQPRSFTGLNPPALHPPPLQRPAWSFLVRIGAGVLAAPPRARARTPSHIERTPTDIHPWAHRAAVPCARRRVLPTFAPPRPHPPHHPAGGPH